MTINLSMLLKADASQAKAELASTGKATDALGKSTEQMGRKGKAASTGTKTLGTSAAYARTQIRQMSVAEARAAATVGKLGAANKAAAGNVGNLVAQFNDIGIMMAAGQNPLQLAIQQGTQITQVIGPMGAAGAANALGSAFVSMLSPINFITLGSIAAGAAMVGWFKDAKPEAVSLDEIMGDLSEQIGAYSTAVELATSPTDKLATRFGLLADNARKALAEKARFESGLTKSALARSLDAIAEPGERAVRQRVDPNSEKGKLYALQAAVNDSTDPKTQVAALEALRSKLLDIADVNKGMNEEQEKYLALINQTITQIAEANTLDAGLDKINSGYDQYYTSRIAGEENLASLRARELSELASIYGQYAKGREEGIAAQASAQKMLQTLTQENAIRAAILRYGEGSAQVAELRASAEQRVFEATLDTMNVSAELKDELRAAFEKGQALAGLNMASGVASAAAEAERLAAALGISLQTAAQIAAMGGQKGAGAGRGGDPRKQGGSVSDWQNKEAIVFLENYKPPRKTRGGGGGGGGSGKDRNAAKDLIKDLKQELAILRETDPVQKEMLRNREALAQATTAEKKTISDLIAQRNNETQSLDRQKETWDFLKDTTYGTLDDLIIQGNTLSDVMDNLAQSIETAALKAILLGSGPLADLLGTGGSGGLIGMALGAVFPGLKPASIPANATGGMIYGPGSGTSDDVLMWGSSGEFMVNAAATKKHRGLLELINSGNDIPGYAAGGLVAPAHMRGRSGGGIPAPAPLIVIENRSSAAVTGETEETVDSSGRRSSKLVLADAVGDAMTTAGGGADRVLKRKYGLRPGGALR